MQTPIVVILCDRIDCVRFNVNGYVTTWTGVVIGWTLCHEISRWFCQVVRVVYDGGASIKSNEFGYIGVAHITNVQFSKILPLQNSRWPVISGSVKVDGPIQIMLAATLKQIRLTSILSVNIPVIFWVYLTLTIYNCVVTSWVKGFGKPRPRKLRVAASPVISFLDFHFLTIDYRQRTLHYVNMIPLCSTLFIIV